MPFHIGRVVYVVSYEIIAIALIMLALVTMGFGGGGSGAIAVVSSSVALVWNFVWTTIFESWERRQPSKERTIRRRVVHALGFEGGLIIILVPIMAAILGITLVQAFILDIGLLAFFLVYTFVFAWLFDIVVPVREKRTIIT